MSDDEKQDWLNTAAIVCEHVADKRARILCAERSEPEDDADSGWQFMCGAEEEDWKKAQVWALHEVVSLDPTLKRHLDLPSGTILRRSRLSAQWEPSEATD
jgi:hypothetical protein